MQRPVACREQDAVVEGVRLHYVEGPASGPPLLLIPGQSMPWQSYTKVLPILAERYHVFAIDVRGHGKSEHTPGHYTFSRLGEDVVAFVRDVIRAPALVSGNSSGGIMALHAAALAPSWIRGIVLEDPPLFTTELPRARDTWVQGFFEHTVRTLPDLPRYFSTLTIPKKRGVELMSFPRPLAWVLGGAIRRHQRLYPGAPVDLAWLPLHVRLFVRGLSEYDVDFTRACAEGRMYDLDQAADLSRVCCPALLVRAASFVHPTLGLVGAMGDEDVARAKQILPSLAVEEVSSPHVVHIAEPTRFVGFVDRVAAAARAA
ncbi:MAG: alpha/beta hydrolase [Sandaracinaceae bacterium]|nr:alpha/beta hydrolase [Sandaracinaceae bacterium]